MKFLSIFFPAIITPSRTSAGKRRNRNGNEHYVVNWLLVWDPGRKELEVWGWSTSWPGNLMLAGRQLALPPTIGRHRLGCPSGKQHRSF